MSTPAVVRVDNDDPLLDSYKAIAMPDKWTLHIGLRMPLASMYNELYALFEPQWWGFIADDVVPMTANWDSILIGIAGTDGMAVPAGGETTGGYPHFILGSNLVRSVGWLALPGLDRIYIDTVWRDIAVSRNVYRFLPDVLLEHRHFSCKKALFDQTYVKKNKGNDRLIYHKWLLDY